MATTATDTERQYDEFGEPIPTEEELAKQRADQEAERLKTEQALKLATGMTGIEGQLPSTLPTRSAPVDAPPAPMMTSVQPPAGFEDTLMAEETRLNRGMETAAVTPGIGVKAFTPPPDTKGRMYMGPSIGADQLSRIPQGGRVNLMPPPSGPPPSQLEQMQRLDQPGTRTMSITPEPTYSDASVANQQNMMRYNAMKAFDAGDRSPATMAAAMGTTRGMPQAITPAQQLNYSLQQQRLNQDKELAMARENRMLNKPAVETETFDAVDGSPAIPEQAASAGFLGIGASPAIPAVPEVLARGERKITRNVQPPAGDSSSNPKPGQVRNGWRYKGGDPSKKSSWEKA